MAAGNHSHRSIVFQAVIDLEALGYRTARVAHPRNFDLIAWKQNELLFIVIKRFRSPGLSRYVDDIAIIVNQIRDGIIPGAAQVWLYQSKLWIKYQIMHGGAVPLACLHPEEL